MTKEFIIFIIFCLFALKSFGQEPTVHSTNISISNIHCEQMDISWSTGNGSNRIIVLKEGAAVNQKPSKGIFYPARDTFYLAPEISGVGNRVVYNGAGSSCTVKGLKKNTTYHIAIFEFNTIGTFEYLTSNSYAKTSQLTENITAAFTIDKPFQCISGNSFKFTNTSSNTEASSISYEWRMGEGTRLYTNDVTFSYVNGGIFKVNLIAESTGCYDIITIRDTVGVPFIVDFGLDKTKMGNDSIQCMTGNRYFFENLFKKPPPIYGVWDRIRTKWTTSDGQSKNSINSTFLFTETGLITVKLVQERQLKRDGIYCIDSITKTFKVLPSPINESLVNFSDTALCLNNNEFTFSHTAPSIVKTTWNLGDGNTANTNKVVHKYGSAGIFNISVQVEDVNGCSGIFLDSVEVFTPPNNYFTGLDSPYCLNDPIAQLVPNLAGGYFYGGNVNVSNQTFNPSSLGLFDVGYVFTMGNCIDSSIQHTEVLARPIFNLGPDTIVCPNTSLPLDVGLAGLSYEWNTGASSQAIQVTTGGLYWAEADNGQCALRDSMRVVSVYPPTLNLGTNSDTTICGGQSILFTIDSDAGNAVWNDGYQGFTRTVDESGYYEVVVTHPCVTLKDDITVSILPFACEIFVPNSFSPNDDDLNETFLPTGYFEFNRMQIFNEYGENLFTTDTLNNGWDGLYQGQVVPTGIYYFVINYELIENGVLRKRVIAGPLHLFR